MKNIMIILCSFLISMSLHVESATVTSMPANKKEIQTKASVIGKDSGYQPVEIFSPYMQ